MTVTAYRQLLQEYVPRPIRSGRAYQKTLRTIDTLMKRPRLLPEEDELLDVLVALVEQYESIQYPTPANPPHRVLAHLMESKGATRAEVAERTGISRSTIDGMLSGRRAINAPIASILAEYFGVAPAVFIASIDC